MNILNALDKKIFTFLLLGLSLVISTLYYTQDNTVFAQPSNEAVNFPDPSFEQAVREELGKMSGTIDSSELMFIEELRVSNRGIRDLTGINYFTNLGYLEASNNNITDLSPLSGHPSLRNVNLGDNLITDITALGQIPNLEYIYLWNNRVTDISTLASATGLRSLYISNNNVQDLSVISTLPRLNQLSIENNKPINNAEMLRPLVNSSVSRLQLEGLNIESLGPITEMVNLRQLDLSKTQITDISGLDKLSGLEEITLRDLRVKDYSPLKNLTFLRSMNLSWNSLGDKQINDFFSPGSFGYLEKFRCSECGISDLSFLKNLPFIEEVELGNNEISDISPLLELLYLDRIYIERNQIRDITGLADLVGLGYDSYIRVTENPLTAESIEVARELQQRGVSIEFPNFPTATPTPLPTPTPTPPANAVLFNDYNLEKLIRKEVGKGIEGYLVKKDVAEITRLDAEGLSIYDLTGIGQLPNLKGLRLPGNNINNLKPLSRLNKLASLNISGNNVSDLTPLNKLNNLKVLVVGNNDIRTLGLSPKILKNLEFLKISNNNFESPDELYEALGQLENIQILEFEGVRAIDNIGWMNNGVFNSKSGEQGLYRLNISGTSITAVPELTNLQNFVDGIKIEEKQGQNNTKPLFTYNSDCLNEKAQEEVNILGIESEDRPDPNNCGNIKFSSNNQGNSNQVSGSNNNDSSFMDPALEQAIMQEAGFSYDMLKDQNALAGINALNLSGRGINDLTGIQSMTNLMELDISENNIQDIWALEGLYGLEHLNIEANPIFDISVLNSIPNLRYLNMSRINNNNLWDIQQAGGNIETLIIHSSGIDDGHMDALQTFYNLREFIADNNNISRLDVFRGLSNFANGGLLILNGNRISDLGPLYDNPSMCCGLTIEVMDNPLDQNSYKNIAGELSNRGVLITTSGNPGEENYNYNSQSSTNVFGTDIGYTGGGDSSNFYYEEEGNSRGFLFNVDEVPEWAQSMGLTDFNTLLDPTVIAMFGIFITLLGTVLQMVRGR